MHLSARVVLRNACVAGKPSTMADPLKTLGSRDSITVGRILHLLRAVPVWLAAAFIFAGVAMLVWILASAPTFRVTLAPAAFNPQGDKLYLVDIGPLRGASAAFFQLDYDSPSAPTTSRLRVMEDGRELGQAHSSLEEIGMRGEGRYLHQNGTLAISTSDNSDPRLNGRTYSAEAPLSPRSRLLAIALALLLVGGARLLVLGVSSAKFTARSGWIGPAVCIAVGGSMLALPSAEHLRPLLWLAGLAVLLLGSVWASAVTAQSGQETYQRIFTGAHLDRASFLGPLAWAAAGAVAGVTLHEIMLTQGASPGLSLGGYFQVSDASGYFDCAGQMIEDGTVTSWCHRRPIYPLFLSGVGLLAGRNLEIMLLLQAGISGACAFLFARTIASWLGPVAGAFAVITIGLYAWQYVVGQTMSEMLGLSLGLISCALLLRAGEKRSYGLALAGVFLFALGQQVRPGAMFALPLLIVWVGALRGRDLFSFLTGVGLAGLVTAGAFALNAAAVVAVGGDPAIANANFAQTLYGLSVGEDWRSLGADYPNLMPETAENVRQIYALAFQKMVADPGVVINSIKDNLLAYLDSPWYNNLIPISPVRIVFSIGAIIATGFAAPRSWRAGLVFSIALGELLSSLILAGDGNIRVWSVSAPLAQIGTSVVLLAMIARGMLRATQSIESDLKTRIPGKSGDRILLSAASILLLLCVAPLSPLRMLERTTELSTTNACSSGLRSVVVDPSTSAWMVVLKNRLSTRVPAHHVQIADLLKNLPRTSWLAPSLDGLTDVQLLRGIEIGPGVGAAATLYAPAELDLPREGPISVCVDDSQQLELAQVKFSRIATVR